MLAENVRNPPVSTQEKRLSPYIGAIFLLANCGILVLSFQLKGLVPMYRKDFFFFSGYWLLSFLCGSLLAASSRKTVRFLGMVHNILFSCFMGMLMLIVQYYIDIGYMDLTLDVYAVLQSNIDEGLEYFSSFIYTPQRLVVAVAVAVYFLGGMYANGALLCQVANRRWKVIFSIAVVFAWGGAIFLFSQIATVKHYTEQTISYYKSLYMFSLRYGQLSERKPVEALKREKGELYILIIGESENRDLMGCYGGFADNTPWMSSLKAKAGFTVFNSAYSAHVLTMQTLRLALAEGTIATGDSFYDGAPNILSIARDAGMKTIWLSNQMSLGKRDNDVSALAQTADICYFTPKLEHLGRKKAYPDAVLLPKIEKELSDADFTQNILMVIHLMGNHYPYKDRYPPDFDYTPPKDCGETTAFENDSKSVQLFYEYLTAIRYTDMLLERISALVARYSDKPVAMMYFSDHGEELYDRRGGGHNPATFTWNMSRIPMWTWLSEGYRSRYPKKYENLNNNANCVFTNDHIYTLFLGLAHIVTAGYRPEYDLSEPSYSLTPEEACIFNGMRVMQDTKAAKGACLGAGAYSLEDEPNVP